MEFLKGTGVAMITPFDDNGEVDFDAIPQLIDHLLSDSSLDRGVDYIVILGTTAEVVTLNSQEKDKIIKIVIKHNNDRVPLVIGVGGNNTRGIVQFLNKNRSLLSSNFSSVLSVCPYYNKPSQNGIYAHFQKISQASDLPIILYNVPSRTGVSLEVQTVIRLANDFKNIIAIKEASGEVSIALELLRELPEYFQVISGDDLIALSTVLAGGSGVISVIAGAFPDQVKKMINYGLNGNYKEAYQIYYQLMPLINLIFKEGNPSGIKRLLGNQNLGLCRENLRLPLVPVSDQLRSEIDIEFKKYSDCLSK
tara:strand:+ start:515 stop:1438 length:924 start_codon:yes stop_codon:yes gene_type:complete